MKACFAFILCVHHGLVAALLYIFFSPGHEMMNHPPAETLSVAEDRWLLELSSKRDTCHFCLHFTGQSKLCGPIHRATMYNLPMGREGSILRTGFNGRRIKSPVNGLNKGIDPIQNLICLET